MKVPDGVVRFTFSAPVMVASGAATYIEREQTWALTVYVNDKVVEHGKTDEPIAAFHDVVTRELKHEQRPKLAAVQTPHFGKNPFDLPH
jgi:hypothetical protein